MKNLLKTDFVDLIAKKQKITKAEAERAIGYFTEGIEQALSSGNQVTLIGFGVFYVTANKARQGRNPRTGEAIKIAASKAPKFRVGASLKKACN